MKILILTPKVSGGGAERVALNLANHWAEQGIDVTLATVRDVSAERLLISGSVRLRNMAVQRTRSAILKFRAVVAEEKPDVVLSVIRDMNILAYVATIGMTAKTNLVFREASTLDLLFRMRGLKRFMYEYLMHRAYKAAACIIANSPGTNADLLNQGFVTNQCSRVIPNPVLPDNVEDLKSQTLELPWSDVKGIKYVLHVGRLDAAKDQATLLRAFKLIYETEPKARLVILGQGPSELALQELARDLKVENVVHFAAYVANPFPYYAAASVFALSSRWEGFGNVLVEALSAGVSVVSTDCKGGPAYVLDNGRYGDLVPVGDARAFADAVLIRLKDPMDKQPLLNRARDFTVERVSQQYLDAIMGARFEVRS